MAAPVFCEHRQRVREATAGLGVQSISFQCRERKPLYQSGDRVTVRLSVGSHYSGPYDDCGVTVALYRGTIEGEDKRRRGRYIIVVDGKSDCGEYGLDDLKNTRGYVAAYVDRITRLDEPPAVRCLQCKLPVHLAPERCEWVDGWVEDERDRLKCVHAREVAAT